jgi:hypothetical protein
VGRDADGFHRGEDLNADLDGGQGCPPGLGIRGCMRAGSGIIKSHNCRFHLCFCSPLDQMPHIRIMIDMMNEEKLLVQHKYAIETWRTLEPVLSNRCYKLLLTSSPNLEPVSIFVF